MDNLHWLGSAGKVNLNQNKLEAYGISPLQVNQAITSANLDFPTGKLKSDDEQILIRLAGNSPA
ncbi:hypothetical protein QWY93_19200 [Echinicola jeungdonensis]|uniref:hypothetical protein n=1 Tax=Echinicola jeungdonensis TaxID=709343 RepID=UPI0025B3546C|nr:hypothetical protein [Echinicola jeungdonensis]MDN3671387.1 hypothetical protein [Echinicola jeungdonensis]